mmetsp:Transcript_13047/g.26761  ORF Transcript_13047/g.26761 Transcript_13047/m.26761 type:complete len:200 (+) Transcript_13047:1100-1699(+)
MASPLKPTTSTYPRPSATTTPSSTRRASLASPLSSSMSPPSHPWSSTTTPSPNLTRVPTQTLSFFARLVKTPSPPFPSFTLTAPPNPSTKTWSISVATLKAPDTAFLPSPSPSSTTRKSTVPKKPPALLGISSHLATTLWPPKPTSTSPTISRLTQSTKSRLPHKVHSAATPTPSRIAPPLTFFPRFLALSATNIAESR